MPLLDFDDELTYTSGGSPSSKQSIVGAAGVAIVGGRVKDGRTPRDWAAGQALGWYVRCVTALVGAGGGVQFDLVVDTAANLITSPTVIATRTIPAASLVAGALFAMPGPVAGTSKQYLGVKMTPLTAASTAGEVIVGTEDPVSRLANGLNYM